MGYLVGCHLPSSIEPCVFSVARLSLAEKNARSLIAAGCKRVDIYDTDVTGNLPIRSHEEIRADMIAQDELPPVARELWPLPHSPEAVKQGCTCEADQIADRGRQIYLIAPTCPIHG